MTWTINGRAVMDPKKITTKKGRFTSVLPLVGGTPYVIDKGPREVLITFIFYADPDAGDVDFFEGLADAAQPVSIDDGGGRYSGNYVIKGVSWDETAKTPYEVKIEAVKVG